MRLCLSEIIGLSFLRLLAFDFLFFVVFLSGFNIRVLVATENEFGSCPSSSVLLNSWRRVDTDSSLNTWWIHLGSRLLQDMLVVRFGSLMQPPCWSLFSSRLLCLLESLWGVLSFQGFIHFCSVVQPVGSYTRQC